MSRPTAIALDRVTKVYDEPVVSDVSLDVQEGSFVTLLGPSGSGKSTILQMIGGFIQPTAGRIFFGGTDMAAFPPNKRPCNTIFQDLGLFPHMTVAENVAYGLKVRGVDAETRRKRTSNMLGIVALEGYERRRMHQLSVGQRQRVALARALILEPAVLLLDEPLTGLDELLRQQLRDEIGRLHRRLGATFVAVTHNQDEALSLSDRVVVLDRGRVQQAGAPGELYRHPSNRFVADFLGTANLFDGVLHRRGNEFVVMLENGASVPVGTSMVGEGREISVMIRPERIRLRPRDFPGGVDATVLECIYHGAAVRYVVRLASGFEMTALSQDPAPAFAPETDIKLEWSAQDLWIIPELSTTASAAPRDPQSLAASMAAAEAAVHVENPQPRRAR